MSNNTLSPISELPPDILHPNHPVVTAPEDGSVGWRLLNIGETIPSHAMVYAFAPKVGWRLSSYFGAEKLVNNGKSQYRVPVAASTWLSILPALVKKLVKGYWKKFRTGSFV